MNPILFLDIDGVLNDREFVSIVAAKFDGLPVRDGKWDGTHHLDPARVKRLNRVLEQTECKVVLSSSWRRLFGSADTETMLRDRGFEGRLHSETPRIYGAPRAEEISAWLQANPSQTFAILDDDPGAGVGHEAHFVQTTDGIEDAHVVRLTAMLLREGR